MKDDDYLVTMSSYVIYVTASYICPWCFYQTLHDITKLTELNVNFQSDAFNPLLGFFLSVVSYLSYVAPGDEITPCIKINKPLIV